MMQKKWFLVISFISLAASSQAQEKYYTKNANINFYSSAPLEDLEAFHKSSVFVLDAKTGSLQFSVLIKGFEFENKEMQEHFNENYLESDKFPISEFKGQVSNNASIQYNKPGTYPVVVKGQLTIHGVTKAVLAKGVLKVASGNLQASSTFNIQLADYGITIPSLVSDKIAKTVKITVDAKLNSLN